MRVNLALRRMKGNMSVLFEPLTLQVSIMCSFQTLFLFTIWYIEHDFVFPNFLLSPSEFSSWRLPRNWVKGVQRVRVCDGIRKAYRVERLPSSFGVYFFVPEAFVTVMLEEFYQFTSTCTVT